MNKDSPQLLFVLLPLSFAVQKEKKIHFFFILCQVQETQNNHTKPNKTLNLLDIGRRFEPTLFFGVQVQDQVANKVLLQLRVLKDRLRVVRGAPKEVWRKHHCQVIYRHLRHRLVGWITNQLESGKRK